MKKITIIMPVFNKEKYIRETIESVLNQSMHDFEFIIVDDGSTDKSGTVLDEYAQKDQRIKAVHISNGGVSNARNIGLDLAEGEYITFIDADDRVDGIYLENLYGCIINSKADMVISGYKKVWENSEKVETSKIPVTGLYEVNKILPHFAKWQKETGIFGYCCSKIFKRELCVTTRFDRSITLAEDFDFYLRIYRNLKTVFFDDKQYYLYLQEAENSSVSKNDYAVDYMSQLKINLRYKEFLQSQNVFSNDNHEILMKLISNYCYFVLFYCDLTKFELYFSELRSIYVAEKLEFVTDTLMKKIILSQIQHNNLKLAKICIEIYRKARKIYRMRWRKHGEKS